MMLTPMSKLKMLAVVVIIMTKRITTMKTRQTMAMMMDIVFRCKMAGLLLP